MCPEFQRFYDIFLTEKVQRVVQLPNDRPFKDFMVMAMSLQVFRSASKVDDNNAGVATMLCACTHRWFFEHFQGVPPFVTNPPPSEEQLNNYIHALKLFMRVRMYQLTRGTLARGSGMSRGPMMPPTSSTTTRPASSCSRT